MASKATKARQHWTVKGSDGTIINMTTATPERAAEVLRSTPWGRQQSHVTITISTDKTITINY